MLERSIAESLIHEAFSLGADFCDIFVEKTQVETLSYYSEKVQDIKSGIDSGVGLRLIFGKQAIYGHTNSLELSKLMELLRTLAARYKSQNNQGVSDISFHSNLNLITEVKNKALKERIQFLNKIDQQTRSKNEKINQVNLSLLLKHQHVEIFNSEGLHVVDYRPYARLGATAIAQDGSLQADGSMSPGFSGGFEKIEQIDTGYLTNFISEQAMTMLHADPCPAGKMPVIIANGFGGVIFHEACGHSLETTAVQKKASEFWDKKGELIANPCLNAVDDGTIDNLWGSLSIDDEGMATQKTQLIKDGRLENFLCDKLGAIKTEHPRTGSGRRQSYRFAPASRMRNTYIEPGESSLDEMLASIEDGVFAKSLGGGSVNPATGEFNFAVKEGYLVKGGKVQQAVKGATLIGKGAEIMKNITMVGNDLEYAAGMCGSVSGSIPVTVGQPAIKVEGILVGGSC